ncbi:hypothetical protein T265_06664 [Opisthorchis viverrini]|uniref:Uncharacterized protein n=1 Tax=Opisthorchis viverrini TaxID=6198 RepID=A0A074ZJJ9_OPIVI|nr:hypothetical protein T265_06664 [Opisthorchis viverrini]KER25967.1 hypothetical protein T265_06664 [Opisthorchis viverrini]
MVSAKYDAIVFDPVFFQLPLTDTELCSCILSDKCLVVQPTHTNEYTQKLVVGRDHLSFKRKLIVGLELKLKHRISANKVKPAWRLSNVMEDSIVPTSVSKAKPAWRLSNVMEDSIVPTSVSCNLCLW